MRGLEELLAESSRHHHHICPRQVLGVRMGLLAGELFHMELPHPDKRLFAFVETDGCGLDGISAATGCYVGRRNMRVEDFGKMAATFVDVVTREAMRIVPSRESRVRAKDYMPEVTNRWQAQLEAYKIMPAEELFTVTPVSLTVSLDGILSRHGLRVLCDVCGEEIMNGREELVDGKTVCRGCAGRAYYTATECLKEGVAEG